MRRYYFGRHNRQPDANKAQWKSERDIRRKSRNFPIIAIPSIALQLFTKTIDKDLFVTTLRTNEITLYRDETGPFHYDGEPYEEGRVVHIKMVQEGLNVLVKKRF